MPGKAAEASIAERRRDGRALTQGDDGMPKTAAAFGAGVAGLSAAHEFARLGYEVSVYEANNDAGGAFRSARIPGDGNMPSEYSWHGMGPWYHNAFELLRQIPFDETGSVYDKGLSRPIDFCLAPDAGKAAFYSGLIRLPEMFRMGRWEGVRWAWLLLKTFASDRRSREHYSGLNAAEQWKPVLSDLGWRTWRASFGPWIGSDWTNVSLHQAGQFFLKQLTTRPSHFHEADDEGPAWTHGARDGWLLLRGPSGECLFDKWVSHLERNGVRFFWNEPLDRLDYDGTAITSARLGSGARVQADVYVLATTPFAAADILERTPALAGQEQLRLLRPLTRGGPHTQVSFRIAFSEEIAWPRERTAVVIADSEFNLTLFAQEQAWAADVALGDGVKALWTGTACVATVPGRLHGLPLVGCTKGQFIDEVMAQLGGCEGLDSLVKEANNGRSWKAVPIVRVEVWHEWQFSRDGIRPRQPKWVNTTDTQPNQPTQATPVPNLVLAGAHTRTAADVWSIEAAVESGRRAARVIEPSVEVIPQYKPVPLRAIGALDDACFAIGAPHVLDLFLIGCAVALAGVIALAVLR
jgi:glycine/D-amino acid oxidase-like deaminating enzyme